MKRYSNLFDQILSPNNLRLAWWRCQKGKRRRAEVIELSRHLDSRLERIRERLADADPQWGNYAQFRIHEPKPRTISAVDIDQRIMHHAIMNILGPVFERHLINHSYACRMGKGTHAAVRYAFSQQRRHDWFVKLDVRSYFDSINHRLLEASLERLIKDDRVVALLRGIVRSYQSAKPVAYSRAQSHAVASPCGLPIGNLTSQFFANHFLSCCDHFALERLRVAAYARYMDDMVLWPATGQQPAWVAQSVAQYLGTNLDLVTKQPVIAPAAHGVAFLGFLVRPQGIYLLRKSKSRYARRAAAVTADLDSGLIDESTAAQWYVVRSGPMTSSGLLRSPLVFNLAISR